MPPIPPPRPNPPPGGKDSPADFQDLADQLRELTDTIKESRGSVSAGPSPFLAEFRELTAKLREMTRPPVIAPNQDAFNRLLEAQAKWAEAMRQRLPPPEPGIPPAMRPTQTHLDRVQDLANQTGQPYRLGTRLLVPQPPRPPVPPAPAPRYVPPVPQDDWAAQMRGWRPPAPAVSDIPSAGLSPLALRYRGPMEEAYRQAAEIKRALAEQEVQRQQQADAQAANRVMYERGETPLARVALQARLRGEGLERTLGAGLHAQLAQARAAYAETPQGQEQFRQQAQLAQQTQEANERRRRAENIAQYGSLGAALRDAAGRVGTFGRAIGITETAFRAVGAGVSAFARFADRYTAAASPQTAATVAGSQQLLDVTVGREFVGLQRERAALTQQFAGFLQEHPLARRTFAYGRGGAEIGGAVAESIGMPRLRLPAQIVGGTAGAIIGSQGESLMPGAGDTTNPLTMALYVARQGVNWLRRRGEQARPQFESFEGLPGGATFTSGEQVMFSAQQTGLNQDPLQGEIIRQQLEQAVGLLQTIATNSNGIPNMNPAWR